MKAILAFCVVLALCMGCSSAPDQADHARVFATPEQAYVHELVRRQPGIYDLQASINYLMDHPAGTMIDLNQDGIDECIYTSECLILDESRVKVLGQTDSKYGQKVFTGPIFNKTFLIMHQKNHGWEALAYIEGLNVIFEEVKPGEWPGIEVHFHGGLNLIRSHYRWCNKTSTYFEYDALFAESIRWTKPQQEIDDE